MVRCAVVGRFCVSSSGLVLCCFQDFYYTFVSAVGSGGVGAGARGRAEHAMLPFRPRADGPTRVTRRAPRFARRRLPTPGRVFPAPTADDGTVRVEGRLTGSAMTRWDRTIGGFPLSSKAPPCPVRGGRVRVRLCYATPADPYQRPCRPWLAQGQRREENSGWRRPGRRRDSVTPEGRRYVDFGPGRVAGFAAPAPLSRQRSVLLILCSSVVYGVRHSSTVFDIQ